MKAVPYRINDHSRGTANIAGASTDCSGNGVVSLSKSAHLWTMSAINAHGGWRMVWTQVQHGLLFPSQPGHVAAAV